MVMVVMVLVMLMVVITGSDNLCHRSLGNRPITGEEWGQRELDDQDQLDPPESSLLRWTLRNRQILGRTQCR